MPNAVVMTPASYQLTLELYPVTEDRQFIQINDLVRHVDGAIGIVTDSNYNDQPEVQVDWSGRDATFRSRRTSLIYLQKIKTN